MKHYKTLSYLLNSHSLPELEQFGTGTVRDEKMSFVDPLLALNTFRALYDLVQHNMPLFDGDDVLSDLDALILVLEDAVKLQSEVCLVIE